MQSLPVTEETTEGILQPIQQDTPIYHEKSAKKQQNPNKR
jgi:hypothetical protein